MEINKENTDSKPVKKPNIPPFFIIPPPAWHTTILQIEHRFKSELKGRFLKIKIENQEDYRAAQNFFLGCKAQFKSFLLDEEKPVRVVLRRLPSNTSIDCIQIAINEKGYNNLTIIQMYRGSISNKKYMPLFLLTIPKLQDRDVDEIFMVTEIYGTQVSIETYREKKGLAQCHNCQGFFHAQVACNLPTRCLKCAADHKTKDCNKSFNEPCTCANCGGSHPANIRSCLRFPKTNEKNRVNSNKKNNKNITKTGNILKQAKKFDNKMADPAQSYAGIANGRSSAPPLKILKSLKICRSQVPVQFRPPASLKCF